MARGRQRHQGRSQRKGAQQQSRAGADKDSQVGIQDQVGHRQQQQLPEHEQQDIIDTFLARLQQLHIGDHSDEDDKKQCQYFDISDDSRAAVQCMEVSDEAEGEKLETGPVILPQTGDSDIGEEGGEEAEAEQLYSGFQAVQSMVGDRDEAEGEQLEAGLLFPAMRSRTPEEAEVVEQLYSGIQAVHEGDTEDECERTDEAVTSTGSPSSSHNSADLYIGVGTEEGNKGETECEWTDEADTSTSSPSSSRIGAKSCARLAETEGTSKEQSDGASGHDIDDDTLLELAVFVARQMYQDEEMVERLRQSFLRCHPHAIRASASSAATAEPS